MFHKNPGKGMEIRNITKHTRATSIGATAFLILYAAVLSITNLWYMLKCARLQKEIRAYQTQRR